MCRIFAAPCHVSPVTCHVSAVTCPQLDTFLFILIHNLILLSNSLTIIFLFARIKNNVPKFCRRMSCVTCHISAATCPQLDSFLLILINTQILLSDSLQFLFCCKGNLSPVTFDISPDHQQTL